MKIIRAAALGMCFGVRDALQIANGVSDPSQVTIHGELVHNRKVNERLSKAGFLQTPEDKRHETIQTSRVLITAHGISQVERQRLADAGKEVIDTTCPLVLNVHKAALELQAEGRHVLLIGKAGHVEVQGVVDDLDSFDVIESVQQVKHYESESLGIVCQTTMPSDTVTEVCTYIQLHNPLANIRFIDTVCDPTKRRQRAMGELLQQVDAMVVVGGHNSNNTRRLVELCHDKQTPVVHVEDASELEGAWFDDVTVVGLTAGTSTLDETVDAVQHVLEKISARQQQEGSVT
ncbi:MAG: 4-hydroxy-3-methylbut-2-enyl diphosphate reductase [Planctomycetaceae bacterium]|nr:4-hydroxy-3-methylbut-2-enyl diphosphate reductase [Planctomycetaceae bacterium]